MKLYFDFGPRKKHYLLKSRKRRKYYLTILNFVYCTITMVLQSKKFRRRLLLTTENCIRTDKKSQFSVFFQNFVQKEKEKYDKIIIFLKKKYCFFKGVNLK